LSKAWHERLVILACFADVYGQVDKKGRWHPKYPGYTETSQSKANVMPIWTEALHACCDRLGVGVEKAPSVFEKEDEWDPLDQSMYNSDV